MFPHILWLHEAPGLEGVTLAGVADQADVPGHQLDLLLGVGALHQLALDADTGVEGQVVRKKAGVGHNLQVGAGHAVTEVEKCVLLLFPQTLDPALHCHWLGELVDRHLHYPADGFVVTLSEYDWLSLTLEHCDWLSDGH